MNHYDVLKSPVITEKSSVMQADQNKYVFKVDSRANKKQIKDAVEKIYDVKVVNVHTMNVRGKMKRLRANYGRTSGWKKALVTLKPGNSIDLT